MTDLRDVLLAGAGHEPALLSERRPLSFGELRTTIGTLVESWQRATGNPAKQLVFCFLRNSVELALVYLGAVSFGQAVGLFPPTAPERRMELLVAIYRPGIVVLPDGGLATFLRRRGYRTVHVAGLGTETATWVAPQVEGGIADELSLLLSTSGSTGSPKLVRISSDNVLANASGIATALQLSPAQRAVTSVPLCYSYGLSILTSHLAAGSSVVVTDATPLSSRFWTLVHRTGTTTVGGTPLIHQVTLGGDAHRLPPSVRIMTQAGARMPSRLLRGASAWAERTGGAFHCMYGQTEATSRITCLDASRLADKTGSVGTPLSGGRVTVGPSRPGDIDGPIRYTGPNVMLGYADCRDDLACGREVDTLETGDVGRLDDDGFLYVTGRSSRFVTLLDRRVSLDDIEEWLGVSGRVAVVAVADRTPIVVFTTNPPAELAAARQEIAGALGVPPSVIAVRQLRAIPRTDSGKIDYSGLEALAARECG